MADRKITLHRYQREGIDLSVNRKVPFVLMLSGVQGGKTMVGAVWEHIQWLRKPAGDHLIVAPTYKHLQQATLRKLDSIIPRGVATYNKADSTYTLMGGGRVWCRSVEDPDSIEGISADSVWADECGKMAVSAWVNMQARRSATRGPWFGTTTPYGINWVKTEIYDKWMAGLPEYRVVHWRSIDSPYFSREEYDRAKRDLSPAVFERKIGGGR